MPKTKTHRGAAKRFKKTGSGKIKRSKAYASHLLGGKAPKEREIFVNPVWSVKPKIKEYPN